MFNTPITLGRLIWWLILGSLMPLIFFIACVGLGFAFGALTAFFTWCTHHLVLVGFIVAVAFEAARRNSKPEATDA